MSGTSEALRRVRVESIPGCEDVEMLKCEDATKSTASSHFQIQVFPHSAHRGFSTAQGTSPPPADASIVTSPPVAFRRPSAAACAVATGRSKSARIETDWRNMAMASRIRVGSVVVKE